MNISIYGPFQEGTIFIQSRLFQLKTAGRRLLEFLRGIAGRGKRNQRCQICFKSDFTTQ
jgi:hypothetical protein